MYMCMSGGNFENKTINELNIYLKYVQLLGILYLKGPDSKNSMNRQARTPLSGLPIGSPDFCR